MMKKLKMSQSAKTAVLLGVMCSIAYLAVYIARNILGAVTPQMVSGGFAEEYIGAVSSVYFVTYAVGQLINGAIGDRIKARWMISIGLFGAGVTNFVFTLVAADGLGAMVAYGATGFFLSMIYGPMAKLVSENTEHIYAVRCSVGYTFSSLLGSPLAGLLASFLVWQSVFAVSSAALFAMAVVCFGVFLIFERRGIIRTHKKDDANKPEMQSVKALFRHQIVKFSLISILTGVVRTSVVFWLPTYLNQYLGFSEQSAAGIFTVATLIISLETFVAVFIYERVGRRMDLSVLLFFGASALFFVLTYFVAMPIPNIIFIVLAIMSANGAAAIIWSVYCPSLRDTGRVSGVTGFLDFLSYMAAALANIVFANAATDIGWKNLILVWLGLMAVGVVIALPYKKSYDRASREL